MRWLLQCWVIHISFYLGILERLQRSFYRCKYLIWLLFTNDTDGSGSRDLPPLLLCQRWPPACAEGMGIHSWSARDRLKSAALVPRHGSAPDWLAAGAVTLGPGFFLLRWAAAPAGTREMYLTCLGLPLWFIHSDQRRPRKF